MPTPFLRNLSYEQVQRERYQRKLAKRDRTIKALRERVAELESTLASLMMEKKFGETAILQRAIQEALANMRFLPVIGLKHYNSVVDIKVEMPNAKL